MVRQQRQIDERLLRIETTLQLQQPVPVPAPVPTPMQTPVSPAPLSVAPPPLIQEPREQPQPQPEPIPVPVVPPQRSAGFETQFGLTILNRLGVLTLVLAASFGFKWAVDNDWIGPGGRVAIGMIAGLI